MPYLHVERRLNTGGSLTAFEDELATLHSLGIRAVVCLLDTPSDASVYQSAGFDFLCLPICDGLPPTPEQARQFVAFVDRCRAEEKPVLVHCEGGLGRTGTMLAVYLIAQGKDAASSIASVRAVEPRAVETLEQIEFLEKLAVTLRANGNI